MIKAKVHTVGDVEIHDPDVPTRTRLHRRALLLILPEDANLAEIARWEEVRVAPRPTGSSPSSDQRKLRGRRKVAALVESSNRLSLVERAEALDGYRADLKRIVTEGIEPSCDLAAVCLDLVDNVIALIGDGAP